MDPSGRQECVAWLSKAFAAVNAAFPEIDWTEFGVLRDEVIIPVGLPMTLDAHNACLKAQLVEKRRDCARDMAKVRDHLEFYLEQYFYSEGIAGAKTVILDQVRTAWRAYYQAHLPTQQALL